jgi:hypothetical protein
LKDALPAGELIEFDGQLTSAEAGKNMAKSMRKTTMHAGAEVAAQSRMDL